ncbi:helix-turn-helix domain-containing protein [Corynebacterium belfantii]|nr:helix-turn-helix domain-containing protein [Corynebacterium belfantii]
MSTRSSLSEEQREQLVGLCEQDLGFTATARRIGVRRAPVRSLYHRWLLHGRLCLVEKPTKKHYSFEIKKEVVDRFLAGETHMDLAKECKLSSPQQVKDWVTKWRTGGNEALRPKPKGRLKGSARLVLLTPGRQTSP